MCEERGTYWGGGRQIQIWGSSAVHESRFGRMSILAYRFVQFKRGFLIGSSGITDR
jgi:hypothetical protein